MITKQDIQNALQENFPTRHIKILDGDADGTWEVLVDGDSILPNVNGEVILQDCNSLFDLDTFVQVVTILTKIISDHLEMLYGKVYD